MDVINILDLCKNSNWLTVIEQNNDLHNSNINDGNDQQKRNKRVLKLRSISEKQHAINLYLKGLSKAEVSRQTTVPESTLRGWIKETQNQGNCVRRQSSSPSSECSLHSDSEHNLTIEMPNCSSDDNLAKSRQCDIQLPFKKRRLSAAVLEEIDNSVNMNEEKSNVRPVGALSFQNVQPLENVLQSTLTPLNYVRSLQNSTSHREATPILKSFKRKRNSTTPSGLSEIENIDPYKAKRSRRKRQSGSKTELQTEEERIEWLKRRQQEISMNIMESVMNEQKVHMDRNQIWTNFCAQQQIAQDPLQLVSDKEDESRMKATDILTIEEAIKHGARFQTWLENCNNPAVSMYMVQEFKKLMSSIIALRKRKLTS